MKIQYHKLEKTIEIKDGLNNHYFIMKFIIVLNLFNAVLRLLNLKETGLGIQEILWIFIGIASLIAFYFLFYNKTTSDTIKIDNIRRLKKSTFFGRSKYSLELVDGKQRDLAGIKDENELAELRKFLLETDIKN